MQIKINSKSFNVNPSELRYMSFWHDVNNGKWEKSSFDYMDKYLNKDSVVIDIGAWIAPLSLYAATIAKKVYSIEPDPIAYKEFLININANSDLKDKIFHYSICISNKNKEVSLWNNHAFGNSGSSIINNTDLISNTTQKHAVKAITLCNFMEQNKIDKCDYLKIDIEGEEINVLPNIADYLIKEKPILHLSVHQPFYKKYNFENIINVLKFAKNIYINDMQKITIDSLRIKNDFYDIICEF